MPADLLAAINQFFLVVAALMLLLTIALWFSARGSYRFIATFPDEVPEKAELLHGERSLPLVWLPLLGLLVMYAMMVWLLAPLSGVILGFTTMLAPFIIIAYANQAAFDAPFAGSVARRARLARQTPDPEPWLAQYRKTRARRQRLGILRHVMVALLAVLLGMGVFSATTIDPMLSMRLKARVLENDLRASLNRLDLTIFTQTPPCVPVRTLYLIPGPDMKKPEAQALVGQVVKWLTERGERGPWRIQVKTGDGPPLAEAAYAGAPGATPAPAVQ